MREGTSRFAKRLVIVTFACVGATACGSAASSPRGTTSGSGVSSDRAGTTGKLAAREESVETGGDTSSGAVGSESRGQASYYSDALAGRKTASGEVYDPTLLTAAHRTLPFGTLVEVRLDNGKSVVVKINDRGPFGKKKRVIDLSRRAAETLGIVKAGVATVTIRVVGQPKKK
ncbi:MAG: septal ring lytic transglycosylase RlpA family protein [Polyangiaceae bacterium]|nr:septal ring lytic transglycosylase RlpA family protein [Polyangiaceae bacterium]